MRNVIDRSGWLLVWPAVNPKKTRCAAPIVRPLMLGVRDEQQLAIDRLNFQRSNAARSDSGQGYSLRLSLNERSRARSLRLVLSATCAAGTVTLMVFVMPPKRCTVKAMVKFVVGEFLPLSYACAKTPDLHRHTATFVECRKQGAASDRLANSRRVQVQADRQLDPALASA